MKMLIILVKASRQRAGSTSGRVILPQYKLSIQEGRDE